MPLTNFRKSQHPEIRRARVQPEPVSGLNQLREFLTRHRRIVAALLAGLGVMFAISATKSPVAPTSEVVVLAKSVDAGHILNESDLVTHSWPTGAGPVDKFISNPSEAIGRMTAGSVIEGEPLTPARIVGPSLLLGADSQLNGSASIHEDQELRELVATSVRIADQASVALARPGDHVDILAASSHSAIGPGADGTGSNRDQTLSAKVVANSARVLAVPGSESSLKLGNVASQSQNQESIVVLAVSPETAARLAGAAVNSRMTMVVRSSTSAKSTSGEDRP